MASLLLNSEGVLAPSPYAARFSSCQVYDHVESDDDIGMMVDSDNDSAFDDGSFKQPIGDGGQGNFSRRVRGLERRDSCLDLYNQPKTTAEASKLDSSEGGLIIHANIVHDNYCNPKHLLANGRLKPRRPIPHVRSSDFFGSLVQTEGGRWIFSGILNGWPALQDLEVLSITCKVKSILGRQSIRRFWDAKKNNGNKPSFPTDKRVQSVRATLRCPTWTKYGWSKDSPGRVFYYSTFRNNLIPTMTYGTNIVKQLRADINSASGKTGSKGWISQATMAHHFAHRYAVKKVGFKDLVTYHSFVLVEWDHGQYTTVFELAWLNGISGYGGKSNWVEDKDSPRPKLLESMPNCMKMPWFSKFSEIRVADHPAKSAEEFQEYLSKYAKEGDPKARFLNPELAQSEPVQLYHCGMDDLLIYVTNYIGNHPNYSEEDKNCQTFAADFFSFLCKKSKVVPFYPLNRVLYRPQRHLFLYVPEFMKKERL